jgi:hypothetical protein
MKIPLKFLTVPLSILAVGMMSCGDNIEQPVLPPDPDGGEEEEVILTDREGVALSMGEGVYYEDFYENETGRFIFGFFSENYTASGNVVTGGSVVRLELLSDLAPDAKFPALATGTYMMNGSKEAFTGLPGESSFLISKDAAVLGNLEGGTVRVFREGKRYGFEFDLALENDQSFEAWFEGDCNLFNSKYISTFDDDVSFPGIEANGAIDFYGDMYGAGTHTWQILMWDSSKLTLDERTGILTGEPGSVLQMELYTPQSSVPNIPNGKYQITLNLTEARAGTVAAGGKILYEGQWTQYGSRYLVVSNGYYSEQAPLVSGTVEFTLLEKGVCSIKVDAVDDLGFNIRGDMSGAFTLSDKSSSTGFPF